MDEHILFPRNEKINNKIRLYKLHKIFNSCVQSLSPHWTERSNNKIHTLLRPIKKYDCLPNIFMTDTAMEFIIRTRHGSRDAIIIINQHTFMDKNKFGHKRTINLFHIFKLKKMRLYPTSTLQTKNENNSELLCFESGD